MHVATPFVTTRLGKEQTGPCVVTRFERRQHGFWADPTTDQSAFDLDLPGFGSAAQNIKTGRRSGALNASEIRHCLTQPLGFGTRFSIRMNLCEYYDFMTSSIFRCSLSQPRDESTIRSLRRWLRLGAVVPIPDMTRHFAYRECDPTHSQISYLPQGQS